MKDLNEKQKQKNLALKIEALELERSNLIAVALKDESKKEIKSNPAMKIEEKTV